MNELLGWYGYDKVDLRESEANEIRNYRERRQHVSVLKGEGGCQQVTRVVLFHNPTGSVSFFADMKSVYNLLNIFSYNCSLSSGIH